MSGIQVWMCRCNEVSKLRASVLTILPPYFHTSILRYEKLDTDG